VVTSGELLEPPLSPPKPSRAFTELSQDKKVVTFKLDDFISEQGMTVTIKHLYGISILDDDECLAKASILDFAQVAVAAHKLKVAGLYKLVFEATASALNACIEDGSEAKLREFLFSSHSIFDNSIPDLDLEFIIGILGENLTKLYKKPVFQQLLVESQKLAICILNYVAEIQSKMEEGQ